MPGVAKDRIEVNVEDRDVAIGYETREELAAEGKSLWRERSYGKASRAIRLPEAVDANAAQAKHVDGVLELTLPKLVKAQGEADHDPVAAQRPQAKRRGLAGPRPFSCRRAR